MSDSKIRTRSEIKEFEFHELMKIHRNKDALAIANRNVEWFYKEYSRWLELANKAAFKCEHPNLKVPETDT